MNPGASTMPRASISVVAEYSRRAPSAEIPPSQSAMSRISPSAPLPSRTFACRMRVSQLGIGSQSEYRLLLSHIPELFDANSSCLGEVHFLSEKESIASSRLGLIDPLNKGLGGLDSAFQSHDAVQLD